MDTSSDKILQSVQQLYGNGETPTLFIGKDFEVLWANEAAEKHPSILTQFDLSLIHIYSAIPESY